MEDESDARTVVESYIERMTPKPDVEPFPMHFCATLVDFVFQQEVSTLGETLIPLITVGYERIWAELENMEIERDHDWCMDTVLCVINTLGATEWVFFLISSCRVGSLKLFQAFVRRRAQVQANRNPLVLPSTP